MDEACYFLFASHKRYVDRETVMDFFSPHNLLRVNSFLDFEDNGQ